MRGDASCLTALDRKYPLLQSQLPVSQRSSRAARQTVKKDTGRTASSRDWVVALGAAVCADRSRREVPTMQSQPPVSSRTCVL